jgi:hypothetical protein
MHLVLAPAQFYSQQMTLHGLAGSCRCALTAAKSGQLHQPERMALLLQCPLHLPHLLLLLLLLLLVLQQPLTLMLRRCHTLGINTSI